MKKLMLLTALVAGMAASLSATDSTVQHTFSNGNPRGRSTPAPRVVVRPFVYGAGLYPYGMWGWNAYPPTYTTVNNNYQVNVRDGNHRLRAEYTPSGQLIWSKETLRHATLPVAAAERLQQDHPGWRVVRSTEIVHKGQWPSDHYRVRMAKGWRRQTCRVTPDGHQA